MRNELEEIHRANKIFKTIKDFETMFPDEFEKCGIKQCGHCRATGFSSKDFNSLNLCTNCGGIGYIGFEKINGEFVCRTCNGYGCSLCNHRGTVDWISHAHRHDILKSKRIGIWKE